MRCEECADGERAEGRLNLFVLVIVVDRKQEGRTFDRGILNEGLNVVTGNCPKHLL